MHRRRRVPRVRAAVLIVIGAAVLYVVLRVLLPVPALAVTVAARRPRQLPGTSPRFARPAGAQAALGIRGIGPVADNGGNREQPIASLAKMMTAYLVLRDHPLAPGASGPTLTVTSADVSGYRARGRPGHGEHRL